MEAFALGGFTIRNTKTDRLLRFLHRRMDRNEKIAVGFANHHFITACQGLDRNAIGPKSILLVNDGIGVQLAALLRFGRGFRENMNGTDFVPRFLHQVQGKRSVYLVGGTPDVVKRAAAAISAIPKCRVVGFSDGYSLWQREREVLEDIDRSAPDILLVGLGNPLQERWILDHWGQLNASVIFGVGALFNWMTGTQRRAPALIRRLHLEWAYRLAIEPRRLFLRYTYGIAHFFMLVFGHTLAPVQQKEAGS